MIRHDRHHVTACLAAVSTLLVLSLPAVGAGASSAPHSLAKDYAAKSGAKSGGPVVYKGGKVLVNSKTYAIYWGTPTDFPSDLVTGLAALLGGFSASSYLATANQYVGGPATTQYMGSLVDTSTPPKSAPNTAAIVAEVSKVLSANRLSPDPNAIYLVYTSNLPKVNYCAWHASGVISATTVQVAYMPNTAGTTSCYPTSGYFASVTNYSYGTRSIADNTAHEFMEAVTDPVPPTGWVDANGAEIGDKCNFNYLAPVTLSVGSLTTIWQIQSEWSNAVNGCAETTP